MPPSHTETAKKADKDKMRQSTLAGPRHSLPKTGTQPDRPETPQQGVTVMLPTAEEALIYLAENDYHKKDTLMSVTMIGDITLKMCEKAKKGEHKQMIEGMRYIGVLLRHVGKEAMKYITRGKRVDEAITELKEELAKKTDGRLQELEEVKKAAGKAEKETKEAMNRMVEGMGIITDKLKAMEESLKNRPQQPPVQTPAITTTNPTGQPTYAATTAMGIPLNNHARVVARGEEAERQIVVSTKDRSKETATGLKTEKELIAKAEMTIKLMIEEGETEPPGQVKFVGGFRAKSGAIIYTLNSREAANWLKQKNRLETFNEKFGDLTQTRPKLFNTIAYYVPTSYSDESEFARSGIEIDNDLIMHSLAHTKYIKAPHKRSKTQKSAHLILGFTTREGANLAIANRWLTIEGKRVEVKKLTTEPRRCYKCQSVKGDHTADRCPEKESRCARCADKHTTEQCNTPESTRCVNCDSMSHGAGSRECPAFIQSLNDHTKRNPEGYYRFYPILGDTKTMELLDGSYGPDFAKKPTQNEGEKRPDEQRNPQEEEARKEAIKKKVGKLRPVTDWNEDMEEGQYTEQEQGRTQISIFN